MPLPFFLAGQLLKAADLNAAFAKFLSDLGATATVSTAQGTASLTYTDLATLGPQVAVTSQGTKALVVVTAQLWNSSTQSAVASFAISGPTTLAADDARSIISTFPGTSSAMRYSAMSLVTITPGVNTYTMKYRADVGGTASFAKRDIIVIAP